MQAVMDIRNHLLVLKAWNHKGFGISASVFPYRNVIGISSKAGNRHCLFGDYEKRINTKQIRKVIIKENIACLFFFQSSEGKHHFISPQILDWLDAIRVCRELGAEYNYLSISSVRQEFILRISKKGSKPEPFATKSFYNQNARNVSLSSSHIDVLTKFFNIDSEWNKLGSVKKTLLKTEKYRTTNL